MRIDEKGVIEVIGRLLGRASSHRNSAMQTTDQKKAEAHHLAADDLLSLADDLANATEDPKYAKSGEAYKWATGKN